MTAMPSEIPASPMLATQSGAIASTLPFHQTELGKRLISGAVAGAAIGAALPFLSILRGALLGAGSLLLWKSVREDF